MKAFRLLIFVLLLVGQSPVTSTVRPLPDRLSTAVADRSLATGFNGWVGRAVSGTVMRDFASYSAATGVAQASATTCLDLTGDERVTVADIDAVGAHWHQRNGDPGWETRYDLDGDGHVDVLDIMRVSAQWPRECVPPDPASIAPPLDRTVATDLASATSFLYTGPTPIQTGVVSGTIEARRVAVLRGRVQTRDGAPLSNVGITVLDHPEYGSTRTREDGMFDLVVNGGGLLTVQYARNEYLPVQRQVVVPWRDYVRLPNVVLITYDSQVTSINLGTTRDYQVAQGSPVSDTAGMRRATLLFPPNLQATMQMPAGNRIQQQAPSTLHVRASEYSVGTRGPEAMPAELPPNTGYTYAVEFSVDEATAAGALGIQFNEPSIAYLENFLNAGVGWAVPAGYYDRTRAIWIPSDNGRVVKILSITDGLANLDTDGDGIIDNGAVVTPTLRLDIPDGERQRLAALYQTGQTLWRVPTRHFSAWDYNWPFGPPPDAVYPTQGAPTRDKRIDDPCIVPGSTIACQNQILGETVPINGTPFNLTYQSDRTLGRKAANTLDIPLSGASVPASLVRIDLQIDIAGRQYVHAVERDHECLHQPPSLAAAPVAAQARAATADLTNRSYQFTWDGEDAYGRLLQGQQPAIVRIGYTYCGVYQKTDRFGYNGGGRITGSRTRDEITLWQVWPTWIGPWDVRPQGLGGWTLDIHHVYDPAARVVYPGYGGQRSADAVGAIATTVTPTASPLPDVAAGPDGSVYFPAGDRVYRLDAQGAQTVVAGTGVRGYSGDGGPATSAQLNLPHAVAVGPDGNVYIADTGNNLIRRVDRDGIITTIAGNRGTGYSPDGLPATEAQVYEPTAITLGADGALYILHTRLHLSTLQAIRRVGPDGMLSTPVGKPDPRPNTCSGDGGPAAQAEFSFIWDMDMAPDGSIYIATGCPGTGARVRRVTPDGFVNTVAGGGTCNRTICGDGGPATAARLELAYGIAAAQDGSFAIVDASGTCVRRVGSEGIISTVAGVCGTSGYRGDGGPATQAIFAMDHITIGPDGVLYAADGNSRIRRVAPALPGLSLSDSLIPAEDGSEVFVFDRLGRHLRTLNTLTGAVIYQFSYDSASRLSLITDGDNNITRIERAPDGRPLAIVAPFGQRTTLGVDANGYLASSSNPIGETHHFTSTDDGLLTTLTDPRGNTYHFSYDFLGRLIGDANPAGGAQSLSRATLANGAVVTRTTALDRNSTYSTEDLATGVQRRVNSFPDGTQSQEQINTDRSRMLTLPDGTVSTVIAGPDRRWGMQAPFVTGLTTTTPGGLALTMAADRTVDLANPADPLSLRSITDKLIINDEFKDKPYTSSYDAAARMFIETTRERRESHTAIDAQARPVRSQIAGLAPVSYTYDTHGRLTTITQGEGESARITALTYNTKGYMDTMTDPLGRTIHFAYDTAGRVTQQTMPDGRVVDYTYDANGNLTNLTPPGRPAHSFTYSPVDLRASYSPPSLGAGTWQTQYLYNADRQITRVTRPDGKIIELGYDSGGRLNTLTTPRGVTTYSYESTTGNLAGIAAPGGSTLAFSYDGSLLTREAWPGPISGTVDRAYDNDFRVISTNLNGSNTISYQYDGDSLLTRAGDLALSRDSQNGLLQGTALGNFTDSWSYNSFGEAIGYRAAYSGGGIFMTQYTYDGLGRITTKSETIGGTTNVLSYTYDLAGHLTAVKQNDTAIASYKYDDNGNRLSFSNRVSTINGTYDDQDRLLQYGPTSYAYTANGELRSKIRDGQTTTYQYDDLGNLIAVSLPNGTQLEYVVDGQNRRIGKKVNGVLIQGFLYQDQLNPIAELDGNGNIVSRFVYASHANAPDYMIKGGVSYRIITDHLGSPRLIVNVTTGEIAQRVDYDEFGNVIEDTNPGFQPFGFAGGIYDQHTKLVRFGVRDYDAETGRWTAKDPVGLEGETTNLYAYVANDPMNWVDPGGMDPCEDVKKMGLARDSAGGVICSGARKIICVWQKSPMPEINECIIEHERSHLEEVNCPQICSFQNYLSLTRPAGKGDECKAYKKQLTCLGRKRSICREPGRTKIQCERFFDFDIGNAKTMMKDLRCYN